jgi:hypothetical protein
LSRAVYHEAFSIVFRGVFKQTTLRIWNSRKNVRAIIAFSALRLAPLHAAKIAMTCFLSYLE